MWTWWLTSFVARESGTYFRCQVIRDYRPRNNIINIAMIFDATSWSWVGTDQDEADLLALLDSSRSRKTSGDYGHSWSATFNGDSCSSLCTDVVEAELLTLSCNLLRSSDAFDDSDQNSRYTTFSANSSLRIDEELTLSRSLRSSELCDNGEKINSTTVDATWYSSSSTNVEKAELLALHCSSKSREVIDDNDHNNTTQQTGWCLRPTSTCSFWHHLTRYTIF